MNPPTHLALLLLVAVVASAADCQNWEITLQAQVSYGNDLSVLDCNHTNVLNNTLTLGFFETNRVIHICVPTRAGYRINVEGEQSWGFSWSIRNLDTNQTLLSGAAPYHNTINCTTCPEGKELLSLSMNSGNSYNGWEGATASIKTCDETVLASGITLTGANKVDSVDVCVDKQVSQHYVVSVVGGPHPNSFSWTIYSGNSPVVSGGVPFLGTVGCPSVCHDWQLILHDRYRDGWNGANMLIYDCNHTLLTTATLDYASDGLVDSCFERRDGYYVEVSAGSYPDEVSWEIIDNNNNTVLAGGAPFHAEINCSQPLDCGNDTYHTLHLRSQNDNWHNYHLTIQNCDRTTTATLTNITIPTTNTAETLHVCLPSDGFVVAVDGDVVFPNSVSWDLKRENLIVIEGGAPFFGAVGCAESPCHDWSVTLRSELSFGWQNNHLNIYDCDHTPLALGLTLGYGETSRTESVCLRHNKGYIVSVGGGFFQYNVDWEIVDDNVTVLSGGAPFDGDWNCTESCGEGTKAVITLDESETGAWENTFLSIYTCNRTLISSNMTLSIGATRTSTHICVPQLSGFLIVVEGESKSAHWSLSVDGAVVADGFGQTEVAHDCLFVPCRENTLRLSLENDNGGFAWLGLTDCDGQTLIDRINLQSGHSGSVSDQLCVPHTGFNVIVGGDVIEGNNEWQLFDGDSVVLSGGSPYYNSYGCEQPPPCNGTKLTVVMRDTFGDGWGSISMKLSDCDQNLIDEGITLVDGFLGAHEVCAAAGSGYAIDVSDTFSGYETSWQLLEDSVMVLEGSSGFSGRFNCPPAQCPHSDWKVLLHDDGGDGWNNNKLKIETCGGHVIVAETTLEEGFNETEQLCFERRGGYVVTVSGGGWKEEVSWELENDEGETVLSGGAPFYQPFHCKQCENITVGSSEGKNEKVIQLHFLDVVCEPVPVSPSNSEARFTAERRGNLLAVKRSDTQTSWDFDLILTCCPVKVECGEDEDELFAVLDDSYGDGWNGNYLEVTSCNGTQLATQLTLLEGHSTGARLCVPKHAGYIATLVAAGRYDYETSWHLLDQNKLVLLSGKSSGTERFNCFDRTLHITSPIEAVVPFSPASFPPEITTTTLSSAKFLYLNSTGCRSYPDVPFDDTVLLVDRGNCTFVDKTLHAMEAKAKLVVILNTDNEFVTMVAPTNFSETLTIPTIMVSNRVGLSLIAALESRDSLDVVFDQERCDTVVVGPSKTDTKVVDVAYYSPICSTNRINSDYWDANDVFVIESNHGSISVTRTDRPGGWGMNLMLQCCGSLLLPSTASPTASITASPTATQTSTTTPSATATLSPGSSPSSSPTPTAYSPSASPEHAVRHHKDNHVAEIVVPTLVVVLIGCGLVFFAHKRGMLKAPVRSQHIMTAPLMDPSDADNLLAAERERAGSQAIDEFTEINTDTHREQL